MWPPESACSQDCIGSHESVRVCVQQQAVGVSLAVAIALHNVPEGVAVALPVYFATKSRWTGFKYAFLSGEPACPVEAKYSGKSTEFSTGKARI